MYRLRPDLRRLNPHRQWLPIPHVTPRAHSFHSTRRLADDDKPIDDKGAADKKKDGGAAGAAGSAGEQADAADVAAEDAETLAQKLQRARELSRRYSSALRRTQRRNKAQDLPPVQIPDWFLKERVFLRDGPRAESARRTRPPELTLSLRRRDTEDVAKCSIPIIHPTVGVKLLTQLVAAAWGGSVSTTKSRHLAGELAATWGLGQDESIVDDLANGYLPENTAKKMRSQLLVCLALVNEKIDEVQKSIDSSRNERLVEMHRKWEDQENVLRKSLLTIQKPILLEEQKMRMPRVSPFVLAEIRATMAASLSVQQTAGHDTFPSARTNLILHSPFSYLDAIINETVKALASELDADVIEISAQDLAEIAGDYLGEGPEPNAHSIRSLGYETYRLTSEFGSDLDALTKSYAEDEEDDAATSFLPNPSLPYMPGSNPALQNMSPGKPTQGISLSYLITQTMKTYQALQPDLEPSSNEVQGRVQKSPEVQLEDLKIANLLEHLIGSAEAKRSANIDDPQEYSRQSSFGDEITSQSPSPAFFDFSRPSNDTIDLATALPREKPRVDWIDFAANVSPPRKKAAGPSRSKIIFIRDIKELTATQYGSRIIEKLEEIVRKQRNDGESIMIVGSTCSRELMPELSATGVHSLQTDGASGFFRNIFVPAETVEALRTSTLDSSDLSAVSGDLESTVKDKGGERGFLDILLNNSSLIEKERMQNINSRHIKNMLHSLDPTASRKILSRLDQNFIYNTYDLRSRFPEPFFSRVLTHDEVHRIALTTLGLRLVDPACGVLDWTHVALAIGLLNAADKAKFAYINRKPESIKISSLGKTIFSWGKEKDKTLRKPAGDGSQSELNRKLRNISTYANSYEKKLIPGIVNPDQIKIGFEQVHVPPMTIDALRTLTSLSFLRPDAFEYGVLATEKISGALLYGPPGTGKTLLAKAVAKESGCAVLEVSGSQINDKYVGEGEKNVTAIFSLARKLSPCIVFLDEADAVLSSRDTGRERASAREILNQFLKEWDGLSDHSVFVMVATNRPFDLDDAVIRRLPRRLLVDLPTENDRKEILKIHLRGEQLDSSVDIEDLAKRTPFYSGSDLKNIAVAAALACVKEENQTVIPFASPDTTISESSSTTPNPGSSSTTPTPEPPSSESSHRSLATPLNKSLRHMFTEKRTLHDRHFTQALNEISASISEDMSSLNAIKKFDEKYGDLKGKKKKGVFGFGVGSGLVESAARVRP